MSINEVSQKRTLFQKIGLGNPQMPSNITVSQQQPPQNPPPQQPQQPQQPPQPRPQGVPPAGKPGCGGCRRKRGR